MENLLGYHDLPEGVLSQIDEVVDIWKEELGSKLIGIYLHGSIALHAFCPNSGDIDLLIVVDDLADTAARLAIAKRIIEIDKKPCPLEISAVRLSDIHPWRTPGNCVFHYSDFWTQRYLNRFDNPDAECYVADREFPDADITSYIKLICQRGIVLYGRGIDEIFPDVSDEDFWSAITADIDEYDFHAYDPRYLASNILSLGRILSFKKEKKILSKYDGGLWMIQNVPKKLKYLPELAMNVWFSGKEHHFPENDLEELRNYLITEIKK